MLDKSHEDDSDLFGSPQPTTSVDTGLQSYLQRVYGYMAGGLALTGLVASFAMASGLYLAIVGMPIFWVILLAPLALVLVLSLRIEKMSLGAARLAFWSYAVLVGLSLAGIFLIYTGASIAETFFIAAAMFLEMSLYGNIGKSLEGFGPILFMGLIAIVFASLLNLFLASSRLELAISAVGMIVFAGLTAWDTQRIKQLYFAGLDRKLQDKSAIMGALTLYLDFLNLFLMLLRFFGRRRD